MACSMINRLKQLSRPCFPVSRREVFPPLKRLLPEGAMDDSNWQGRHLLASWSAMGGTATILNCIESVEEKAMTQQQTPVWFITGCSTGFGRELTKLVLARGWRAV